MRPPYTCLYREIHDDPKFYGMNDIGQLIYLYVISTPMGNGLGCFKAGMAAMIEEKRLSSKRFRKGFNEGLKQGLFEYDTDNWVLLIPKYFERNAPANPNGIKALSKEFVRIPDCELKLKCYLIVREWVERQKESFAEPFAELFAEPICVRMCARSPSPSPSPSLSLSPSSSDPLSPSVSSYEDNCAQKPISLEDHKKQIAVKTLTDNLEIHGPKKAHEDDPDFERFWHAYPKRRRTAKLAARKAWNKAKVNGLPTVDELLAILECQKLSQDWTKDGGEYIPGPAPWLNQGRWDDEVCTTQAMPKNETPAEAQHRRSREALRRLGTDTDTENE